MAIDASFFVKHIRPWGLEAVDQMAVQNGPTCQYLLAQLRMQPQQIAQLLSSWAQTAMLPVTQAQVPNFIATATSIAIARWDEHGQTQASTILFMPSAAIQELSQWGDDYPNQTSDVMLANRVQIAVTIFRNANTAPQVNYNVDSLPNVVVLHGMCLHMSPLSPG
jgi:hypothetical protein